MYSQLILLLVTLVCAFGGKPGERQVMDLLQISEAKDLLTGVDLQVNKFNKEHRAQKEFRVVLSSINNAEKQIVAGTMYYVEVLLVDSTCKNVEENDGKTIEECPMNIARIHTARTCYIQVWSRQWLKDESQRLKVSMKCLREGSIPVGGPQDMTKKQIRGDKALLEGIDLQVEKINKEGRAHRKFRVVLHSIIRAQRQVVGGVNYFVVVKLVESTCDNVEENDGKSIEECPANEKAVQTKCLIKIFVPLPIEGQPKGLSVSMKC